MNWLLLLIWGKKNPEANGFDALRVFLICSGILAVPIVIACVFFAFAPKTAGPKRPPSNNLTSNPLESARQTLSRETDFDTCRAALTQLNTHLAKNEADQAARLSPEEEAALRERCGLDADELAEISGSTFTSLDNHYLEQCFLLRDAAAALDVELFGGEEGKRRLPPLRQAEVAFAWAVRQVRLEKFDAPTVPAQYVLRRGWGTALERALVFLELLRHVGTADEKLTGCLLYSPDKIGDMRLWACGVLVNDKPDLYLFDPRLGLPLPGPNGKGIATLAEVRTDQGVLAQLTVSDATPYDVTTAQALKAELRYVCSLSALSKRMHVLETKLLPPAVKVHLFVDAVAETNRLQAASPPKSVIPWQDGRASGVGLLRRFLPPEEGGIDVAKPYSRRDAFVLGLVPWRTMQSDFDFLNENRFPPHVGLGQQVRRTLGNPFLEIALQPHHARDELLRGRFSKAIPELVELRRLCQEATDRMPTADSQKQQLRKSINEWIERAIERYAEQQRARGNPQKLEEANRKIEALWKEAGSLAIELEGTRAVSLRREISYQLALCKHEQAERLHIQTELDADDVKLKERTVDAWKEAVNLWQQYLFDYGGKQFTGNVSGTASRLLGRARLLSGDRDGAVHAWRQELTTSELEKVGTLYLAKNLQ